MRSRATLVVAACALGGAFALYPTFFRSTDEERIRKVVNDLAAIVMVKDGDTILSRMARLRSRMKDVVDDDVRVDVAELSINLRGRTKLEDDAAKAGLLGTPQQPRSTDCAFTGLAIKIDPAGTLAPPTVSRSSRPTAGASGRQTSATSTFSSGRTETGRSRRST
jgi:hypothetical protein